MKPYAILLAILSISATQLVLAQKTQRLEPEFWWANMPVSELQLQLYGENLGNYRASIEYDGITITKQIAVDSPNYLFLYLELAPNTQPGTFEIQLASANGSFNIPYELKERESQSGRNLGFDSSDLIYLMMPDRFANGNTDNDEIEGLMEGVDRNDPTKRQGGDIKGILDHLDYIEDLGMTAIWFTPMFENDSPPDYGGYHGYAASDLYRVDRRLGSNEDYQKLVSAVHSRGMKVIMDMIHNHIGLDHWWMEDLPTKDWVHDVEEFGYTNFKGTIPGDTHASEYDKTRLIKGWFVPYMPDLNQRNELLADYLIQNTLWWIEYSGIDGIRMDTYIYPYPEYMARWCSEVLAAYPDFNIVGEVWTETVPHEAYWQLDPPHVGDGYDSKLPTVTDFPTSFAIRNGLNEDFGWETGISRLYYTLAQDSLYSDPNYNVIFLDNHDMARVFEQLGKDEEKFKIAYTLLLTLRGIPQVYYGTELMMGHENRGGDDEAWRQTMPGGWPDDERSVFKRSGRSDSEEEILKFTTELNHWRMDNQAIHDGDFLHFVPDQGTYVYFRHLPEKAVMVAVNTNESSFELDLTRFKEVLGNYKSAYLAPQRKRITLTETLTLPAKSALVIDLQN